MTNLRTVVLGLFLSTLTIATPIIDYDARFHPVRSTSGMVATQETHATRIGIDILNQGGNAIDAAVAVGFALAVSLPRAGNLGGGGFMTVYIASENKVICLDYRETAPQAAHRDMFLDADSNADPKKSQEHLTSSGVPGTVYGLTEALKRYGTLPLATVIEPAIRLARDGITVSDELAASLLKEKPRLSQYPETARLFYDSTKEPGDIFKQPDLAWSLTQIKADGADAFYTGKIAKKSSHT